jgi:hypothetical protein
MADTTTKQTFAGPSKAIQTKYPVRKGGIGASMGDSATDE